MNKIRPWLVGIVIAFSIVGIYAAINALSAKYAAEPHGICTVSEAFDCERVNTSVYSEFFGIPVSAMGIVAYVFFFLAIFIYNKTRDPRLMNLMVFGSVLGFLFSLYLTAMEAFVIHAWCLYCVMSQISILLIMIAIIWIKSIDEKDNKPSTKEIHQ